VVESPVFVPRLRGAKPSTTVWTLSDGASYTSQAFSGSGWRFASYLFKSESSSGPYLKWQAFGASRLGKYGKIW
jgi:hypothetical protein